jgi:hypothetical protein
MGMAIAADHAVISFLRLPNTAARRQVVSAALRRVQGPPTLKIELTPLAEATGDLLEVEIVERKGLGHPDTLCDHLTEELSLGLSRRYLAQFGRVLPYNVDKALL